MADNRLARELENRENTQRTKTWQPPQILPTPRDEPGWKFRWVRMSMMGQADPMNMSAKTREGWEPVKAADYPELGLPANSSGNAEHGGLLLCKIPQEVVDQRTAFYAKQATAQMEAVNNNYMKERDNRSNMDLFAERKTEVSFGKGK